MRALVLDLVGLTRDHLADAANAPVLAALAKEGRAADLVPPTPAVTCTAQATLTTGAPPAIHGIVGNGWMDRATRTIQFWEQPSALVEAPRVWDRLRERRPRARSAALFLQHSLYSGADVVVTPKPEHLGDREEMWCHSRPPGLYEQLIPEIGEFPLHRYWGPLAGIESSRWIAEAAVRALRSRPDLAYVYFPHLDYDAQRFGPASTRAVAALREIDALVGGLLERLRAGGLLDDVALFVLGEYAIEEARHPVLLNRALREAGLLKTREVKGREYFDFDASAAVAVVDHQIAHVHALDPARSEEVRDVLAATPGVDRVLDAAGKAEVSLDHSRAGDFVALAKAGAWFAYPYWRDDRKAPPWARTVDIHRKPGYDPAELFADAATRSIPLDPSLVRGTHGRSPRHGAPVPAILGVGPAADAIPGRLDATQVAPILLRLLEGDAR